MARKLRTRRIRRNLNPGKGKTFGVQVNRDQWPDFTDAELQDLFGKHMQGRKSKKKGASRARGEKPAAHIYIGLGSNPLVFDVTICPKYPCSSFLQ